ncbi:hypothetical protein PMI42_04877 [Bradyrhizobium sp. YR681]|uniref:hypothetical protein n=1 Tax=Bradyrhizobium sp. YR681 TaxID=1144344 RepID=UPI000271149A|nr:hypothetical protein [Bradyrhizobium sp. YR681]EJN11862.1 hypothetical protein PMI42_04877 [Bradyrhizobium sp. YR681]
MAETVGLLILSAAGATEAASGFGAAAVTLEIAGTTISAASIVGAAAITAASIGLSYALAPSPDVPKPENGSQAIRQAVPPRVRGYGRNRMAGAYMFFEAGGAPPNTSYDVIAYHHGEIERIAGVYLNDDSVTANIDFNNFGTLLTVNPTADGYYGGGHVTLELWKGTTPQPASSFLGPLSPWSPAFHGHGIAYLVCAASAPSDPTDFTKFFPHQKPEPSVVADCALVWDPRDPEQDREDPSTWPRTIDNPVIGLIDYLTGDPEVTGGPGLDYDIAVAPVLDQLLIEASLCDDTIAGEPRYACNGWYQLTNNPEDVIGKFLATCDGWLSEGGDGTIALTVGYYREPAEPPLTDRHIVGWSVENGVAEESLINHLDITITDPAQKYVSAPIDPVEDEESIAIYGKHDQPLDLSWVQSEAQGGRLGRRGMLRLNTKASGTLVTDLYGLVYIGKRWVRVQDPRIRVLNDAVIEIQSATIRRADGQVVFGWKLVDVSQLEESIALPKMYRQDGSFLVRQDGSVFTRQAA